MPSVKWHRTKSILEVYPSESALERDAMRQLMYLLHR